MAETELKDKSTVKLQARSYDRTMINTSIGLMVRSRRKLKNRQEAIQLVEEHFDLNLDAESETKIFDKISVKANTTMILATIMFIFAIFCVVVLIKSGRQEPILPAILTSLVGTLNIMNALTLKKITKSH